ncbi:MAG TPA: hypothetical protein VHU14_03635 [Solirubrobacterales bacterium]|jgi:hypothetical protein|nr:hypothetical protein [Solirubrobacterales bacterium]
MIKRRHWVAALGALVLLALPAIATAAGPIDIPAAVPARFRAAVRSRVHSPVVRSSFVSRFDLKARHGYSMAVIGFGDIVGIEVVRDRPPGSAGENHGSTRGRAVTVYVARGTVTTSRIEASFGDLGRVSMRFRPSGQVSETKPQRHCKGPDRFTSDRGVFVGSVRFTGEDNYLSVRAHRAKGTIRSPLHLRCSSRHISPPVGRASHEIHGGPGFSPTFLAASSRHGVAATEFLTVQIGRKALFLAIDEHSQGSIAVVRYAFAVASSNDLVTDDAMTSAAVTPPTPFAGKGTYSAWPDGTKAWAGPLRVFFPGAPRTSLTGPQFEEVALASGF